VILAVKCPNFLKTISASSALLEATTSCVPPFALIAQNLPVGSPIVVLSIN
jgi:hypothetical protein